MPSQTRRPAAKRRTSPAPRTRRRFPRTLGRDVGRFFAGFRHTKGPTAGQPFVLEPWQQHDVDLIYELLPNGRRAWRSVLWGVSRGNGKSPSVGGLGLVEAATREDEPEVYTAGVDRRGAKIIHGFQTSFVHGSAMNRHCYVLKNVITYRPTGAVIETMSGDGYRAHGLSPSASLRDEKHAWITDRQMELHNALASATQKRFDSVEIDITTAGWDLTTLLGEQFTANLETMDLDIRDDGYLIVGRDTRAQSLMIWRGAPEDADPTDPRVWRKANPASWITDHDLFLLANKLPANVFRRLILNQWTEAVARWLPIGAWEAHAVERTLEPGTPVVLVFTGTYQRDSAALVVCTTEDDKPHVAVLGMWEKPSRADDDWTVPAAEVDRAFRRAMSTYTVTSAIVDKPGWEDESDEWFDTYGSVVGFPLEKARGKRMVAAAARFFALVVNAGVTHDGTPGLKRQLAQVVAKETPDGAKIERPKGADGKPVAGKFIDAAVCAILAVDEAMNGAGESVYETRGLKTTEGDPDDDAEEEAVYVEVDGDRVRIK